LRQKEIRLRKREEEMKIREKALQDNNERTVSLESYIKNLELEKAESIARVHTDVQCQYMQYMLGYHHCIEMFVCWKYCYKHYKTTIINNTQEDEPKPQSNIQQQSTPKQKHINNSNEEQQMVLNVCLLEILLQTLQVSSSSLLQSRAISCSSSSISLARSTSFVTDVYIAPFIFALQKQRPLLIVSVYLPTKGCHDLEEYIDSIDQLFEIYQRYNLTQDILIGRDINEDITKKSKLPRCCSCFNNGSMYIL
jgi:hypothetical protein